MDDAKKYVEDVQAYYWSTKDEERLAEIKKARETLNRDIAELVCSRLDLQIRLEDDGTTERTEVAPSEADAMAGLGALFG